MRPKEECGTAASMTRQMWIKLSDWVAYVGIALVMGCLVIPLFKYGDTKVTRREPDASKGWVYRFGGGGYGTLEEVREDSWYFGIGALGMGLALTRGVIRVYKLGLPLHENRRAGSL